MPRALDRLASFGFALLLVAVTSPPAVADTDSNADRGAGDKKALTFTDLMQFRTIQTPILSDDGSWAAYELRPDRGDGEVIFQSLDGERTLSVPRGQAPALSADGAWAAAKIVPSLEETETAGDDDAKATDQLYLVSTSGGAEATTLERVKAFAFSNDGKWLLVHHEKPEALDAEDQDSTESTEATETGEQETVEPGSGETEATETEATETETEGDPSEHDEKKDERLGTELRLRHLESGTELSIAHVESAVFSEEGAHLAYAVAAPEGKNGLFVLALGDGLPSLENAVTVGEHDNGRYTHAAWAEPQARLAVVAAVDDEDGEPGPGAVHLWDAEEGARQIVGTEDAPDGFFVPSVNELTWSRDGERLFFGFKPKDPDAKEDAEDAADGDDEESPFDPYDTEAILAKTELDVWHVDDPSIKTNARQEWEEEKDRTYLAVHHLKDGRTVSLGSLEIRQVDPTHAPGGVIGRADTPYLKDRTWDGFYADLYWIPMDGGEPVRLAERVQQDDATLSPDGRQVVWYEDRHWFLWDGKETRNLTAELGTPFADEDHDYPMDVPGYGSPGWLDDGSAVLIYDKFDLWSFPTGAGEPVRLTDDEGRETQTRFRLWDLDPDADHWSTESPWLLTGYRDQHKNDSVWSLSVGEDGAGKLQKLEEKNKRFSFVAKAEDADRILFTRESYREFPDLRIADTQFQGRKRLSDANPQIADFAWGHAELVEFANMDGVPMHGVLIRPETLAEGERCPVLIYYYRFFSQRLHRFNEPKVNHRPSFPVYASHGYCVFLPDVRFEVGRPGLSAVRALVPGVQKLVDMGVADPDALGLHGHSWSGYQTAFAVTQTNIFAAAVAGAPVSNMTSAYGGIRYGSGLARQFQYEKSQSRLGVSLWENRDLYIENSPLFYADRIHTPLLLQFGDVDEAVPWTQGIELYLALRRLGKEAVFLQYRDEPHHLKKYANKLDYAIKMKQYFDHYLKGEPAAAWITEGVPYRGD